MTWQVFAPAAIFGIGQGAATPIFALRALELGASTAVAGVIVALSGLGMVLDDLPAGRTVSRIGEQWSIVAGSVLGAVGVVLCIGAWNLLVLGIGMLLLGVANAVWGLARQSYLVSVVPPADRGRALSTLAGSMRLGFFIGPFLGAGVVHWIGLSGGLWVQLVAIVVSGALMASLPDAPAPGERGPTRSLASVISEHRKLLRTLGIGALMMGASRASRTALLPLWAAHIGLEASTISLIFGISGAVDVLMSYPSGVLMDRLGRRAIAVPSMAVFALGYLVLPLSGGAVAMGGVAVILWVRQRAEQRCDDDDRSRCGTCWAPCRVPRCVVAHPRRRDVRRPDSRRSHQRCRGAGRCSRRTGWIGCVGSSSVSALDAGTVPTPFYELTSSTLTASGSRAISWR